MKEDAKQQQQVINTKVISPQTVVQQPSAPVESPINRTEEVVHSPMRERVNKPLGQRRNSAFSLKSAIQDLQEKKEEEEVLKDDLPRNSYTVEAVKAGWNKFLDQLKTEHNIPAYNALSTTEIALKEDNVIELEFISASSESEFETYRKRIVNHLRGALQNYYFKIEIKFSEAEAKSHILTTKQKFELFVEKNPIMLKLKDEFGLDLYE